MPIPETLPRIEQQGLRMMKMLIVRILLEDTPRELQYPQQMSAPANALFADSTRRCSAAASWTRIQISGRQQAQPPSLGNLGVLAHYRRRHQVSRRDSGVSAMRCQLRTSQCCQPKQRLHLRPVNNHFHCQRTPAEIRRKRDLRAGRFTADLALLGIASRRRNESARLSAAIRRRAVAIFDEHHCRCLDYDAAAA